ncbi:MAG: sprT domain-containing protein [Betaproteobacteria bacterium HGW-Betaproteobacteria-15]|nr:MAG: sprT domain-containing protein [Betaproteobacteria bacterium HGW-Betaproteobacteria-15]
MDTTSTQSPTAQNYAELQRAYDHFNRVLFQDKLPACLITLQREKRTCGYFSQERFADLDGRTTDEIALNPAYFAVVPLVETMQTLVHEMAHQWQFHFGKPGRGRYHNDEWAARMEALGLMPSSTGKPGGKRTGDHMADYAIEGGDFLQACAELITHDFRLSWYDRFPGEALVAAGQQSEGMRLSAAVGGGSTPAQSENVKTHLVVRPTVASAAVANKSNRAKYSCACSQSVWGKPGLRLRCELCESSFIEPRFDTLPA